MSCSRRVFVLAPAVLLAPRPSLAQPVTGLTGVIWGLESIDGTGGTTANPEPERYTVQFLPDGTVAVRFDCNSGGGTWSADGASLSIGELMTTLIGCPDPSPLEPRFSRGLSEAISWSLPDDRLRILTANGDTLVFMTLLTGTAWEWTGTTAADGTTLAPDDPSRYAVALHPDGALRLVADCNTGSGTWHAAGSTIALTGLGTTKMGCPDGSLAASFLAALAGAERWRIESGNLILVLADGALAVFQSAPYVAPAPPVADPDAPVSSTP
jgi:heat shock protein HslJ